MKFTNYSVFYRDVNSRGVEYAAEHTKALGFDAVEFLSSFSRDRAGESVTSPEKAREAKKILDAYALPVSCYSVGADIYSAEPDDARSFFKNHIDMAAELGSPYFHHTTIPWLSLNEKSPSYDGAFKKVIDLVEEFSKYAGSLGMTSIYEPQGRYFNGVGGLSRLYDELADRGCNVGICYDLGNPLFVDTNPVDIGAHFAGKVKHVHVKDYIYTDNQITELNGYITKGGKRLYDTLPGKGFIDIKGCFDTLKGYTGDISFEIFGSDEDIKYSIEYIKNLLP